jgi:rRNA processing protein Gar1
MAKTITENIRKSLTTGLIVYDQNGEKVGYIDQAFGEQGWMQIRVSEFGRKTLWVPYRLVSTGKRTRANVASRKRSRKPREAICASVAGP